MCLVVVAGRCVFVRGVVYTEWKKLGTKMLQVKYSFIYSAKSEKQKRLRQRQAALVGRVVRPFESAVRWSGEMLAYRSDKLW
jgi:hypothetical protein